MPKFKLTLKGNKAVIEGLKKINAKAVKGIGDVITASANDIEAGAKSRAPRNNNFLHGSIAAQEDPKNLRARIEVGASYAPYVEFGTGAKTKVPAGLEQYADQFKGSTGKSWQEFEENIKQWMRQRGIEEEALYPIMASIYRNGINAHPFLFPAFDAARPNLIKDIKQVLEDSTK